MRTKLVGNKGDVISVVVKSAEASAAIPRGTPVVLACNGTDDGLAVVLPGTAGSALNGVFPYGVVTTALAAGETGEAIVFGYCGYAVLRKATRAASTDSWSASAVHATGQVLIIDSVNNCFSTTGGTNAATMQGFLAVLMQSVATVVASASATSDTRTALTTGVKVFVRML